MIVIRLIELIMIRVPVITAIVRGIVATDRVALAYCIAATGGALFHAAGHRRA